MDNTLGMKEGAQDPGLPLCGGARIARARVAAGVAKAHAAAVDSEGRFPREALAEIRRQLLLGVLVPTAFGGEGATLSEVLNITYLLGQACSSTALIYAMHQVKVACIFRHAGGSGSMESILRRIAQDQLLLASSTTEGNRGGGLRSSEAAVVPVGDQVTLQRQATVISYALEADGIVTTARRSDTAAAADQVLLVLLKSDYELERLTTWDALGMRGTASEGFTLRACAAADQILAHPYERIHAQTMVPFAHLLWGSVWAGIAAAAARQAQAFSRLAARKSGGQLPPGVDQLTQALASLTTLRSLLTSASGRYEASMSDDKTLASMEFQSMMMLTKVQASELAVSSVMSSLQACGLAGYRNDGDFSVGRLLRDVLSAPLMINNERILSNLSAPLLMQSLPDSLAG